MQNILVGQQTIMDTTSINISNTEQKNDKVKKYLRFKDVRKPWLISDNKLKWNNQVCCDAEVMGTGDCIMIRVESNKIMGNNVLIVDGEPIPIPIFSSYLEVSNILRQQDTDGYDPLPYKDDRDLYILLQDLIRPWNVKGQKLRWDKYDVCDVNPMESNKDVYIIEFKSVDSYITNKGIKVRGVVHELPLYQTYEDANKMLPLNATKLNAFEEFFLNECKFPQGLTKFLPNDHVAHYKTLTVDSWEADLAPLIDIALKIASHNLTESSAIIKASFGIGRREVREAKYFQSKYTTNNIERNVTIVYCIICSKTIKDFIIYKTIKVDSLCILRIFDN